MITLAEPPAEGTPDIGSLKEVLAPWQLTAVVPALTWIVFDSVFLAEGPVAEFNDTLYPVTFPPTAVFVLAELRKRDVTKAQALALLASLAPLLPSQRYAGSMS